MCGWMRYKLWMNKFCMIFITKLWDAKFVTHEYLYFEQPLNKVNTHWEEGNWLIEEENQNLVGLILGWDATFARGLTTFIGMVSL
jgi:hypothetical protein